MKTYKFKKYAIGALIAVIFAVCVVLACTLFGTPVSPTRADGPTQAHINAHNTAFNDGTADTEGDAHNADSVVLTTDPAEGSGFSYSEADNVITISSTGSYYLGGDLNAAIVISASGTVNLCLSGYKLDASAADTSAITVNDGATLVLFDCCAGDGKNDHTHSYSVGTNGLYDFDGTGFSINGGVITGGSATSGGGVNVNSGASFTMYGGVIAGNSAGSGDPSRGGGVFAGGTFNMYGGAISGNIAPIGGGVSVRNNAVFTMTDGIVSNNTAATVSNAGEHKSGIGGGVNVGAGTFNMEGGTVSGNAAQKKDGESSTGRGGGVYIYSNSTFKFSGGTISENTAYDGAGVFVYESSSKFEMSGGNLIKNNASHNGGGIYINEGSNSKVTGGVIGGKTAEQSGGITGTGDSPVWDNNGNTATFGGGVYVNGNSVFTMTNGEISYNRAMTGGGIHVNASSGSSGNGNIILGSNDEVNKVTITQNYAIFNDDRGTGERTNGMGGGVFVWNNAPDNSSNTYIADVDILGTVEITGNHNTDDHAENLYLDVGVKINGDEGGSSDDDDTYKIGSDSNIGITLAPKHDGDFIDGSTVETGGDGSLPISADNGGVFEPSGNTYRIYYTIDITCTNATVNTGDDIEDGKLKLYHSTDATAGASSFTVSATDGYVIGADSVKIFGATATGVDGVYTATYPAYIAATDKTISVSAVEAEASVFFDFDGDNSADEGETTYYATIEEAFAYATELDNTYSPSEDSPATVTLLKDAQTESTLAMTYGDYVVLDLSGKMLMYAGSSNASVITVEEGWLTVQDSSSGSANSHAYYVDNSGLWVFDDGNSAWDAAYSGASEKGSVTGGVITGGTGAAEDFGYSLNYIAGGGIYAGGTDAIVNINGGTIAGNTAQTGGGIALTEDATLNITGGTIAGNTAVFSNDEGGHGGGIFVYGSNTEIIATSAVQISDNVADISGGGIFVYGDRSKLNINGSTATVEISGNSIVLSSVAETTLGIYGGGGIYIDPANDGSAELSLNTVTISNNTVNATALPSGVETFGGGGILLYRSVTVNSFTNVTITGNKVEGQEESTAHGGVGGGIYVEGDSNGEYDVYNFVIENSTITSNSAHLGGGVYVGAGIASLNGTTVIGDNGAANTAEEGGGIYIASHGDSTADNTKASSVTIEGSAAVQYNTAKSGAGVYVTGANSDLILRGSAKISNNTASDTNNGAFGGGVYFEGGIFTMSGGTISANTANNGAGVYVESGEFALSDGTIGGAEEDANAATDGGGVYLSDGEFAISGGEISYNTATGDGAGVHAWNSGTFTMTNGSISNNKATGDGGGIYLDIAFAMQGGVISANNATDGGGIYMCGNADFTMTDGTIGGDSAEDGNTATTGNGGGIYVNGTFTMSAGTISYNVSTSGNGGGIYGYNSCKVTINATSTVSISYNKAENGEGGGIFTDTGSELTIGNASGTSNLVTIEGNKAKSGGGISVNPDEADIASLSISYAKISDNTATENGGGIYLNGVVYAVSNGGTLLSDTLISGNTALNGGGIYATATGEDICTLSLSGGSITNNTASSNGAGIYVDEKSALNISGNVSVSNNTVNSAANNVYLESGVIVNGSDDTANNISSVSGAIGITLADNYSGIFAYSANSNSAAFSSDAGGIVEVQADTTYGYKIYYEVLVTVNGGGEVDFSDNIYTNGSSQIVLKLYHGETAIFTAAADNSGENKYAVTGVTVFGSSATPDESGNYTAAYSAYATAEDKTITVTAVEAEASVSFDYNGDDSIGVGETAYYATVEEAFEMANDGGDISTGEDDRSVVTLLKNAETAATLEVDSGCYVTLDLNGYVLSMAGGSSGSVIYISGDLTLTDSRPTVSNELTVNGASKTYLGGVITGGTGTVDGEYTYGGGIYADDATLTIEAGTIAGNTALYGGGIYIHQSDITINAVSTVNIVDNTATGNGGGIDLHWYSSFITSIAEGAAEGTAINFSGNTATENGGGIAIVPGSGESIEFSLSNLTVTGNTAANGAGIYIEGAIYSADGSYSNPALITDSVISGNTATGNGGGLYVEGHYESGDANVEIGAGTVISSNTAGSNGGSAVYVDSDGVLTMTGGYVGGTIVNNGGAVSITGGYLDDTAYNSVQPNIGTATGSWVNSSTHAVVDIGADKDSNHFNDSDWKDGYDYAVYSLTAITVTATPGTATYDGSAIAAGTDFTVSATYGSSQTYSGTFRYEYRLSSDVDGAYTDGLPVNAGTYTINVTADGGVIDGANKVYYAQTADTTFEITIAQREITPALAINGTTGSSFTYDGTAHTITATAATGVDNETVTLYVDGAASKSVTNVSEAGDITISINSVTGGQALASNYKLSTDTLNLTIDKATLDAGDLTYTAPDNLVYDGNAKVATVTSDGLTGVGTITVYYSSTQPAYTAASPVNVGTYYVFVTVGEGTNYNAVTAETYIGESFTVTERAYEVNVVINGGDNGTVTMGGTVLTNGSTIEVAYGEEISLAVSANTGYEYDISGAGITGDNGSYTLAYNETYYPYGATLTIDFTAKSWRIMFLNIGDFMSGSDSLVSDITISIGGVERNPNASDFWPGDNAFESVTFSYGQEVTVSGLSLDGYAFTGWNFFGDTGSLGALDYDSSKGVYVLTDGTVNFDTYTNDIEINIYANWNIDVPTVDIEASNYDSVDDSIYTAEYDPASGVILTADVSHGASTNSTLNYTYSWSCSSNNGPVNNDTSDSLTVTDVVDTNMVNGSGEYTLTVTLTATKTPYNISVSNLMSSPNSVTASAKATVNITPATVAAPTAASGLVYNGQLQTGVAVASGYEDIYTVSNGTAINAGNYTATVTLTDKTNYVWSDTRDANDKTVAWSIGKLSLEGATITLNSSSLVYNGQTQTVTISGVSVTSGEYTLNPVVTSDYTITGGNSGENAGGYTLTITAVENGNYSGTATVSWNITAKQISEIAWTNKTPYTYNGVAQAPVLGTQSWLCEGDTLEDILEVSISGDNAANNEAVNVGNYTAEASLKSGVVNYEFAASVTNKSVEFEIQAKQLTAVWSVDGTQAGENVCPRWGK